MDLFFVVRLMVLHFQFELVLLSALFVLITFRKLIGDHNKTKDKKIDTGFNRRMLIVLFYVVAG